MRLSEHPDFFEPKINLRKELTTIDKSPTTMTPNTYQLPLSFEQILTLVKQLPNPEKLKLSRELEKETRDRTLTQLLESFQTDELSLETIEAEVETVRAEFYGRQQAH
jgi:hypothetical protein